eukprot:365425-Chlamydomonas_euryale.AAC.22
MAATTCSPMPALCWRQVAPFVCVFLTTCLDMFRGLLDCAAPRIFDTTASDAFKQHGHGRPGGQGSCQSTYACAFCWNASHGMWRSGHCHMPVRQPQGRRSAPISRSAYLMVHKRRRCMQAACVNPAHEEQKGSQMWRRRRRWRHSLLCPSRFPIMSDGISFGAALHSNTVLQRFCAKSSRPSAPALAQLGTVS